MIESFYIGNNTIGHHSNDAFASLYAGSDGGARHVKERCIYHGEVTTGMVIVGRNHRTSGAWINDDGVFPTDVVSAIPAIEEIPIIASDDERKHMAGKIGGQCLEKIPSIGRSWHVHFVVADVDMRVTLKGFLSQCQSLLVIKQVVLLLQGVVG